MKLILKSMKDMKFEYEIATIAEQYFDDASSRTDGNLFFVPEIGCHDP